MNPLVLSSVFLTIAAGACAYAALQPLWGKSRLDRLVERQRQAKHSKSGRKLLGGDGLLVLADDNYSGVPNEHDLRRELQAMLQSRQQGETSLDTYLIAAACVAVASLLGILFRLPTMAVLVLVGVSSVLPVSVVRCLRKRRTQSLEAQMPRAFECLANSLRTGRSLASALEDAIQVSVEPLRTELSRLHDALELGTPLIDSLDQFEQRVPGDQVGFLVAALKMQAKLGGDVSKSIDIVTKVVRSRLEIQGQVKALSAEARMSGLVLFALPIFAFVGIYMAADEYVMTLWTDPLGRKMVWAAVTMQVLGGLTIQRILSRDW
jgi:tight adherence protein B